MATAVTSCYRVAVQGNTIQSRVGQVVSQLAREASTRKIKLQICLLCDFFADVPQQQFVFLRPQTCVKMRPTSGGTNWPWTPSWWSWPRRSSCSTAHTAYIGGSARLRRPWVATSRWEPGSRGTRASRGRSSESYWCFSYATLERYHLDVCGLPCLCSSSPQVVISVYEVVYVFVRKAGVNTSFEPWARHLIVLNTLLVVFNSSINFAFYCGDVVFRECLSAISRTVGCPCMSPKGNVQVCFAVVSSAWTYLRVFVVGLSRRHFQKNRLSPGGLERGATGVSSINHLLTSDLMNNWTDEFNWPKIIYLDLLPSENVVCSVARLKIGLLNNNRVQQQPLKTLKLGKKLVPRGDCCCFPIIGARTSVASWLRTENAKLNTKPHKHSIQDWSPKRQTLN